MKQSDIVKLLRKEFGQKSVIVLNAGNNKQGILDIIISYNAIASFCEIKIGKDTLTKMQLLFLYENQRNSFCIHFEKNGLYHFCKYVINNKFMINSFNNIPDLMKEIKRYL